MLVLLFQFHFSPFCFDFLAFLLLLAGAAVAATVSGFAATEAAAASFVDGDLTAAAAADFNLKDAFLAGEATSAFTAMVAAGAAATTAGVASVRAVCHSAQSGQQ
jgi:hypothetical protein